ncbi:hypothetical protein KBD20_03150 [Candidatus Saccharibacteria bacterium]|nr:hypothetical protein [Candidatus Saccharibacteria bacterium]
MEDVPTEIDEVEGRDFQISLALNGLLACQEQLDAGVDFALVSDSLNIWRIEIYERCNEEPVTVSGNAILCPDLDEGGLGTGTVIKNGTFSGTFLDVAVHVLKNELGNLQPVIGIKIGINTEAHKPFTIESPTFTGRPHFFAPISNSVFSFEDTRDDLDIMPESDDVIALELNQYINGEQVDLYGLSCYVSTQFGELNELQKRFYLGYLNRITDFETMSADVPQLLRFGLEDDRVLIDSSPQTLSGIFRGFRILWFNSDTDGSEHPRLVIAAFNEDFDEVGAFVDESSDIQLKK